MQRRPALTTRGMGTAEMSLIADLIDRALSGADDAALVRIRGEVETLATGFPLYQGADARVPVA